MAERLPRIRVAAIIVQDGRILLARHKRHGQAYWVLPGGGVDFGESTEQALIRELKEEANLDIRVGRLVMVNDSIPPDGHRHIVNLYFTAEITGGTLRVGDDHRLVDMCFVPVSEIPGLALFPDTREQLAAGIARGFENEALYLGNLWKEI